MKQKLNILLLTLLLLVVGTFSVSAQIVDADGQYVDTVFNDHVDRTAEDFVMVSLMISQPSNLKVYSFVGHAGLRLQCPTFDLDYVFAYISVQRDAAALDYITLQPTMGLFVLPTEQYIEEEFRGVREYEMFLPPRVETELWRILDEEVAKGYDTPFDWMHGSCAQKVYQFVNEAIATIYPDDSVQTQWLEEYQYTVRELFYYKYATEAPWHRLLLTSYAGYDLLDNVHMSNGKKVLFPEQLLALWHNTTLCDKPLLSEETKVYTTSEMMTASIVTPIRIAIVLLLLSLVSLGFIFCQKRIWLAKIGKGIDYTILTIQTMAAIFLMVMMWVAYLPFPQSRWNWLFVPFNILPAVCWKWRKYWALPYALVLFVWCVIMVSMNLWAYMLVDWSHILMVVAWMVIILKQYIQFVTTKTK